MWREELLCAVACGAVKSEKQCPRSRKKKLKAFLKSGRPPGVLSARACLRRLDYALS